MDPNNSAFKVREDLEVMAMKMFSTLSRGLERELKKISLVSYLKHSFFRGLGHTSLAGIQTAYLKLQWQGGF